MPMNGTVLGDEILAAVDAAMAGVDASDSPVVRQAAFRAIATAIVTHIQVNATVAVISVSGVTAGAAVSGPGTGTVL